LEEAQPDFGFVLPALQHMVVCDHFHSRPNPEPDKHTQGAREQLRRITDLLHHVRRPRQNDTKPAVLDWIRARFPHTRNACGHRSTIRSRLRSFVDICRINTGSVRNHDDKHCLRVLAGSAEPGLLYRLWARVSLHCWRRPGDFDVQATAVDGDWTCVQWRKCW
jgi:hypothetical protein